MSDAKFISSSYLIQSLEPVLLSDWVSSKPRPLCWTWLL